MQHRDINKNGETDVASPPLPTKQREASTTEVRQGLPQRQPSSILDEFGFSFSVGFGFNFSFGFSFGFSDGFGYAFGFSFGEASDFVRSHGAHPQPLAHGIQRIIVGPTELEALET